ncbi:unnamed protein product [Lactuca virosa]|uniref:Uncharacterized protein n=1 Tax=Lactuca virosa TaxID=75947 RepID=A0AAU9MVQ9_9ASTR|nr:unnamed protein product [Lactuca virosa]
MGWDAFSCFPFNPIPSRSLLTSVLISFFIALQNLDDRHTDCRFTTSLLPNNKICCYHNYCRIPCQDLKKRRSERESTSRKVFDKMPDSTSFLIEERIRRTNVFCDAVISQEKTVEEIRGCQVSGCTVLFAFKVSDFSLQSSFDVRTSYESCK